MSILRPSIRLWITLSMAVATLCFSDPALAQKKPAPAISPAPGTIYFTRSIDGFGYPMRMNGDGTAKTSEAFNDPSYDRHAGARWFLDIDYVWEAPPDESGIPPAALFAVNQLDWSRWKLMEFSGTNWPYGLNWGKDDSFLSFLTDTWNADGTVSTRLFVLAIDWSLDVPIAAAPQFVLEAEIRDHYYDWSPAGDQLVYEILDAQGVRQLYVATFSEAGVQTRFLATGQSPEWSPNGGRIAFSNNGICTIRPDGSGALRLTQPVSSKTEQRYHSAPSWSPDGLFLAFGETIVKSSGSRSASILRIPAAGGTTVNLTNDLANCSSPRWTR